MTTFLTENYYIRHKSNKEYWTKVCWMPIMNARLITIFASKEEAENEVNSTINFYVNQAALYESDSSNAKDWLNRAIEFKNNAVIKIIVVSVEMED